MIYSATCLFCLSYDESLPNEGGEGWGTRFVPMIQGTWCSLPLTIVLPRKLILCNGAIERCMRIVLFVFFASEPFQRVNRRDIRFAVINNGLLHVGPTVGGPAQKVEAHGRVSTLTWADDWPHATMGTTGESR